LSLMLLISTAARTRRGAQPSRCAQAVNMAHVPRRNGCRHGSDICTTLYRYDTTTVSTCGVSAQSIESINESIEPRGFK
jgi:hypothetical protein